MPEYKIVLTAYIDDDTKSKYRDDMDYPDDQEVSAEEIINSEIGWMNILLPDVESITEIDPEKKNIYRHGLTKQEGDQAWDDYDKSLEEQSKY